MAVRTTMPKSDNKYFLVKPYGWSPCILGNKNNRPYAHSVLVNCVGWVVGAFNENLGLNECKYLGSTNAENFVNLAKKQGLKITQKPVAGGVLVWSKGKVGNSKDGAGHVAMVVKIIKDNSEVQTSESGWGYTKSYFTVQKRKKGNGNWGLGSSYKYLGCINPPEEEWKKGKYKLLYSKPIRTSYHISNNIVKVKECTKEVQKHLTSKKPNDNAYFKIGTEVDITEIYKENNGRVWGRLKNCWICICNKDGEKQAKKI